MFQSLKREREREREREKERKRKVKFRKERDRERANKLYKMYATEKIKVTLHRSAGGE